MTTHAWLIPYRHPRPADLERWLEGEAAAGRHLCHIGQFSSLRMALDDGPPGTVRYIVDLQARRTAEYLTVFEDSGWEYVGQMSSLHVWRRPYSGERPDAFTDRWDLAARDRRVVWAIGAVAVAALVDAAFLAAPVLRGARPDGARLAGTVLLTGAGLALAWLAARVGRPRRSAA